MRDVERPEMSSSPHLDRDWLYQKYVVEQLSTYDTGKIVGRDPKRIYDKLRDFCIQTRPRGENLKGPDNYIKSGAPNAWLGHKHTEATRAKISAASSKPKPALRGAANGRELYT